MENKVIIIGTDHANTLGVIRSFGENNIKPYLITISKTSMVSVTKSKYVKKFWIVQENEMIIDLLLNEFIQEDKKLILIATSDAVAYQLDKNYNKLKSKFILANINNEQGKIIAYMDKYFQYTLAKKYNLNMAWSKKLNINTENDINVNIFPCIIKPLTSFNAKKDDIKIANNKEEFIAAIAALKEKDYKDVLIQELIDYDYECDMSGFCFDGKVCVSGYIQKERIWPLKRGSLTFGLVKKIDELSKNIENIKELVAAIKYTGIFDIEFFVKKDKVYLNEINFRNSGLTYLYGNSYICYYYYKSVVKNRFIQAPIIENDYYIIDEHADIHNVIDRNIKLHQYLKDKKKAKILLETNKEDKKPGRYLFLIKILKNLKLIKR